MKTEYQICPFLLTTKYILQIFRSTSFETCLFCRFQAVMEEIADVEMPSDDVSLDIVSTDPSCVKEFTKKIVRSWISKYEQNSLSTLHFEKLWMIWVPEIYSPSINESCLNWNFNEDLAQDILLNTLEEFICNGDPNVVLKQLSEMDKTPSVCIVFPDSVVPAKKHLTPTSGFINKGCKVDSFRPVLCFSIQVFFFSAIFYGMFAYRPPLLPPSFSALCNSSPYQSRVSLEAFSHLICGLPLPRLPPYRCQL